MGIRFRAGPSGGGHDTSLGMASSKCSRDDTAPSGMMALPAVPQAWLVWGLSRDLQVGVWTPKQPPPLTSSEPSGTEFIHLPNSL